ncbi:MAG TPA: succinate dehydrogenase assembly factor 2 [Methylococcaceae bacterium]|nr:succinate dehydrogenase assembly factor 2 [Methylococcaceae bacterium]
MSEQGRLRWRCRRGTKELDGLLAAYLDRDYLAASSEERAAFERLLDWPDDALLRVLLNMETPAEKDIAALVATLRATFHRS